MQTRSTKYKTITMTPKDHQKLMVLRDKWVAENHVEISLSKFIKMRLELSQ